jgi:thiol-disulfide isomerase/thioredoxin
VEGAYIKAQGTLYTADGKPEEVLAAVDAFAKLAPKDDRRVPSLLFQAARMTPDADRKAQIEDRILNDFPAFADRVKGARRQREGVGKPFELEFQEAISGKTISLADLKGKVVVVDFWATWCGPCVAEMPKMKQLYADYKEKGVEFVGVSLDQPEDSGNGLTKLKEFVKEKEIGWPQYYQGKGWESEFSRSWGIDSIPAVFVVAPDGKLHSTEARGMLEEMIPALLGKAGKTDAGEN